MQTEWGRWSLVEASRLLLRSALTDPLNQRFVLVSESCIPLYPPTTIWQQLLSEDKSRLDACKLDGVRSPTLVMLMHATVYIGFWQGTDSDGLCIQ